MEMSGSSESTVRPSPSGEWPAAHPRPIESRNVYATDRLNTPFRRTLVYLLARTRGGRNRCRILKLLREDGPRNANRIAGALGLHYTTVQHHLTRLVRDDIVAASPRDDSYGALFYLTYQMERNAEFLEEIFPALDRLDGTTGRTVRVAANLGAVSL